MPSAEKSAGKGLRHFSMKVCEKVESKGRTTYNEVADELVAEYSTSEYAGEQQFDEKNIRRRVYDALNVLMAMNIISKEKKDITWQGLPQGPDSSMQALQADKTRIRLRMDKKNTHLAELVQQHEALLALLARNGDARRRGVEPPPEQRIALPFILVQTDAGTHVEVAMTPDRQVVHLDFNQAQFQIYDDAHVLSNLQLVAPVLPVG
jgi:transcription factor Dp-1